MNFALADLHFLRLHWLWALLALPLLWWLWRARQRRHNVWRETVDAHLLPHLLEDGGKSMRGAWWSGALGYALAILALAGPSWRQAEQPLWRAQAPLVVALDLSGATNATDLPPSRLLQARAKLAALLGERAGGQIALVVYAGAAFTVAPLTDDFANVALFLDALAPEVMPAEGQDAAAAIEWSEKLLRQGGFSKGDILLITDNADAAARAAAARAAAKGFRVSALGLGNEQGAAYRTLDGRIARTALDAASLRALAAAGGGRYTALTADTGDLRVLGVLDPQQADAQAASSGKALAWRDEGYWLLLPLMLLGLLAFRRGGIAAAFVLCALLPLSQPAQAQEGSLWRRADQQQHLRIEQGVQAYRNGDFATAEKAFSGIGNAEAQYNLGNALAKQGRYDEAIAAYDEALEQRPGMEDALANRKAVDAARRRQQQGKSDSQQPPSQNKGGKGGKGSKDQQEPQKSKPSEPDNKPAQARQDEQSRPQNTQPRDSQQQADAAQREKMEQAMQQKPQDGDARKGGETETPAQRERRQAVEAQLRRVPDDPGGLLRTKFRLEYERRLREGQ